MAYGPCSLARYVGEEAGCEIGIAGCLGVDVDRRHVEVELRLGAHHAEAHDAVHLRPRPARKASVTQSVTRARRRAIVRPLPLPQRRGVAPVGASTA